MCNRNASEPTHSTFLYFIEVKRKGKRSSKTQSKHYLIQQSIWRLFSPSDVNPHKTVQQVCEYFKFCLMVPVTWAPLLFLWSFILSDPVWIMSNTWALFTVWLQSISLVEWGLSLMISNSSGTLNYCYTISAMSASDFSDRWVINFFNWDYFRNM